jgi:hypothetical protein
MSQGEEFHEAPRIAWLSQEEKEHRNMHIAQTPADLCEMAQTREKLNIRLVRAVVAVTLALATGLLYNVYRIEQPWIRVGQAWTLGVLAYLFLAELTHNRQRMGANEPCAQFLQRQHEQRRCGYLRLRRGLFLFIPGIVACWWGNASVMHGRAPLARFNPMSLELHSAWLFLMTGAGLVLAWIAFGEAAKKAAHDRDELRRTIGNYDVGGSAERG